MYYEPHLQTNSPETLVWRQGWGQATIRFTQTRTKDYLRLAQSHSQESALPGESQTIAALFLVALAPFTLVVWVILGFLDLVPDSTQPLAIGMPAVMLGAGAVFGWVGSVRKQRAHDADTVHTKKMEGMVSATLSIPSIKKATLARALDRVNEAVADDLVALVNDGSVDVAVRAVNTLVESQRENDFQDAVEVDRAVQAKVDSVLAHATGPRRGKETL